MSTTKFYNFYLVSDYKGNKHLVEANTFVQAAEYVSSVTYNRTVQIVELLPQSAIKEVRRKYYEELTVHPYGKVGKLGSLPVKAPTMPSNASEPNTGKTTYPTPKAPVSQPCYATDGVTNPHSLYLTQERREAARARRNH